MSLFKEEESLRNFEDEGNWLFWRWMEEAAYKEDMRDPSVREEQESACVCGSVRVDDTDYSDIPF